MTSRQRSIAFLLAVVLLVGCLVVIAVVLRNLKAPMPQGAPASDADARQLIESGHVGLAHLENHDTARSIPIFSQIAAKLPQDPFGPRNLAVSQVLALGEEYEHATPQRIADAGAALRLAEASEGRTAEWRWLSARVAAAAQDYTAAEEHLLAIIAQDRNNAAAWYELSLVRQAASRGQPASAAAATALQQAFRLESGNLFLLVEYFRLLESQVVAQLAEINRLPAGEQPAARRNALAQHSGLAADLGLARTKLLPFQDRIRAISRVEVVQLVDEALAAVNTGELAQLGDRAGQIARVMLGVAATDRNLVRRHVLEFVLSRYRPEFYGQQAALQTEPAAAIDVTFAAAPEWQLNGQVQGTLSDVRAVEVADFDLDGRPDLIVLDQTGVHVYGRTAASTSWQQIAAFATAAGATGFVVQDLDLDFDESPIEPPMVEATNAANKSNAKTAARCPSADVDIVAFGPSGVSVLRNVYAPASGARSLQRAQQALDKESGVTSATAADLDADGDLDLVIAAANGVMLWSNRGNATFEDISQRSSLPPASGRVTAMVGFDWDRDVDIDIVLGGEQAGWLENLRHGQTRWRAFDGGFLALAAASELEPLDADTDGSWDLLAATTVGLQLARTITPQSGVVRPLDSREVSNRPAQHLRTLDYDNDGISDFVAWDEAGLTVYRGLADGRFQTVDLIDAPKVTRGCRGADFDRDGDIDLVVAHVDGATIYINQGGNKNKWLDVALVARQVKGGETSASGRVNAHGVGSLLELKAAVHYQPAVVRGQSTHFGLGQFAAADAVRTMWLNGVPQNIIQPAAEQEICEQQVLTGSCPYLYTWNGREFEFVTDLLWAAPLGLQAADGVLLPWREWEYLKIPGEKLAAKNGEYILQLTEELWEAAYFDEVKLIAVDHPQSVNIYSNEKVGPPDIAQFKIHNARDKRRPVAAHNHRGRDLSGELGKDDGDYAKPFDQKLRQGLVEEHYIELDLGDLNSVGNALRGVPEAPDSVGNALSGVPERPDSVGNALSGVPVAPNDLGTATGPIPARREHRGRSLQNAANTSRRVVLFLTGWIYPSGTSLNVAISQNPALLQPRPPALLVPDGKGGWREALAYMGFPGGKTKTIAVDMSGLLTEGDYRVRVATNLELYWDEIFFTVDEPAVELQTAELELQAADLHYRGFSRIEHDAGHGPEHFLYDQVATAPKWPPMQGRFTRFGDITKLLAGRDDRLVVMGAGDEVTLRFRVPANDPPPGYKRDFLLYSVGWDKDANLCTVVGEAVEPLPYGAMRNYPPSVEDRPPDTADYRDYLHEFQRRVQTNAFWRSFPQADHGR